MRMELLKARADRLRLPKKEIAARAGLDETTVGRTLNGNTVPLVSTLNKIDDAIAQEERELLDYLAPRRKGAA